MYFGLFRCMVVSASSNHCDCTGLDSRNVIVGFRFTPPLCSNISPRWGLILQQMEFKTFKHFVYNNVARIC
jgi:hypothetical protein